MMIAAHPDDESLAAGILLQRAIASGAAVRVIYASDGESNPWRQRLWAKKWHLTSADRDGWFEHRRHEALVALLTLGVDRENACFLGLPDQGLTRLLVQRGAETARALARMISDWRPTHLLLPSAADTHPDHSALAVLLSFAIPLLPRDVHVARWTYLVHGNREMFARAAMEISGSQEQTLKKRRAIACHATQLMLSRRRLIAYARHLELFKPDDFGTREQHAGALRFISLRGGMLRLTVRTRLSSVRSNLRALHVAAHNTNGEPEIFEIFVTPRKGTRIECCAGRLTFTQRQRDDAMHYEISIATEDFDLSKPVFAKLDRPTLGIYDEGWLEIRPPKPPLRTRRN